MPHLQRRHLVDDAGLEKLRRPRDDVVGEAPDGADAFGSVLGPFHRYRRALAVATIDPAGRAAEGGRGPAGPHPPGARWVVDERIEFRLAGRPWTPLLSRPMAWALRRPRPPGWQPWWAPPSRLDPRSADVLGLLAALALVSAYLGTLLSQTLTFAAGEFGAGTAAQGVLLAAARLGVVAMLVATAAADRLGRRRLVQATLMAACVVMGSVAAAPALVWFGVGQTVARGLVNAADVIVLVLATEEVPARCRAYAASLLALVGGLGSGMVVWLLPLADVAPWGWRLLYLPPLAFFPLVAWAAHHLPESRRYLATEAARRRHRAGRAHFGPGNRRRLGMLAAAAFLLLVFAAPASQFQNEFLRDERGFSAARVTAFTLLSGTPAGLGVWLGGRLAESIGRRRVGAIGLTGGSTLIALSYLSDGALLWAASVIGTVIAALTIPAMRVYGPELFPTRLRSRANGVTTTAGMAGSAVGVLAVGWLAERWGGLGPPIALLAVGPLVVAALVVAIYPETANRTLEDLNPDDDLAGGRAASTTPRTDVASLAP